MTRQGKKGQARPEKQGMSRQGNVQTPQRYLQSVEHISWIYNLKVMDLPFVQARRQPIASHLLRCVGQLSVTSHLAKIGKHYR